MDTPTKSKEELPWTAAPPARPKQSRRALYAALFASLLVLYPLSCAVTSHHGVPHKHQAIISKDVCPQVEPLAPSSDANRKLAEELGAAFADSSFEAVAAEYLGAAVRVP